MPLDFNSSATIRNNLLRRNLSNPYGNVNERLPIHYSKDDYTPKNLSDDPVKPSIKIDDEKGENYANNLKNNSYTPLIPYVLELPTGISLVLNRRGLFPLFTNTLEYNEFMGRRATMNNSFEFTGDVTGGFTWRSSSINNPIGDKNTSDVINSSSTNYFFREDSILNQTQQILNATPKGGAGRGYPGNVIDQTTRIFRDGDRMISKGSAIKYVDQFSGTESGAEFCRVWTKSNPYMLYSDNMKTKGNIRQFKESILDSPHNLNIAPQNGSQDFQGSTNVVANGKGFNAKKYMLSIENLAWKSSNRYGFTYNDLPYAERGPNGGRVMWFPPYGLSVTENSSAKWTDNTFIGRVEPIYTYNGGERTGTLNFKVVVDHPSILNLLVRKKFSGMSDAEADNYINAFFAGCVDADIYELARKYAVLDKEDIERVLSYINGSKPSQQTITVYKKYGPQVFYDSVLTNSGTLTEKQDFQVFFDDNSPSSTETYPDSYNLLEKHKEDYIGKVALAAFNLQIESSEVTPLTDKINAAFAEAKASYEKIQEVIRSINSELAKGSQVIINLTGGSCITEADPTISANRIKSVAKYIISEIPSLIYVDGNQKYTYIYSENGIDRTTTLSFVFHDKQTSYSTNGIDCSSSDLKSIKNLSDVIYCRSVHVYVSFNSNNANINVLKDTIVTPERTEAEELTIDTPALPSMDEVKRILMKLLGEQYYFDAIKEDSPHIYKSLRDKLKYFHPAFHSTTPEGLNSRLTFLNQCLRPGDTIPIVQVDGERNVEVARNTTFGPPPICVLRIGDFYHSKVIIRDVNINFEDNVWDMNPEGIGYQPMIANVQMSFAFIGGQGLKEPVAELQNALSSNFYANTEMYDYRATATEDREKSNKEFLQKLVESNGVTTKKDIVNKKQNSYGDPIGIYIKQDTDSDNKKTGRLSYTSLINETISLLNDYSSSVTNYYNLMQKKYGKTVASIMLAEANRKYTSGTFLSTTVNLIGTHSELKKQPDELVKTISTGLLNLDFDVFSTIKNQLTPSQLTEYQSNYKRDFQEEFEIKMIANIKTDYINAEGNLDKIQVKLISNIDKINLVDTKIDGLLNKDAKVDGITREYNLTGSTSNILTPYFAPHLSKINTVYSNIQSKLTNESELSITEDTSQRVNLLTSYFTDSVMTKFLALFAGSGEAKVAKIKNSMKSYLSPKITEISIPTKITPINKEVEFDFEENMISKPNDATIKKIFSTDNNSTGSTYNFSNLK